MEHDAFAKYRFEKRDFNFIVIRPLMEDERYKGPLRFVVDIYGKDGTHGACTCTDVFIAEPQDPASSVGVTCMYEREAVVWFEGAHRVYYDSTDLDMEHFILLKYPGSASFVDLEGRRLSDVMEGEI